MATKQLNDSGLKIHTWCDKNSVRTRVYTAEETTKINYHKMCDFLLIIFHKACHDSISVNITGGQ